ncbi:MAG: class I SAM-dependent methyltransferase [Bacteroidia bacterium]|nr:class I SAM-dependent methyltransferase [Bacteroidia bacterium]
MNDRIVWDKNADTYEEDVFNVFRNDKKGIIKKYVKKHADKEKTVIDFGCGIGNALPIISPAFGNVTAVDISRKCIDRAKAENYDNVSFKRLDLALKKVDLDPCDFLICCNVAISGNNKRNYRILKNALSVLNKNGSALFVLPSFESMSLSTWRLVDWYNKEDFKISDIPRDELVHFDEKHRKEMEEGIVYIQDAPTKHYRLPELFSIFHDSVFQIETVEKVEYDWSTELHAPPKWIREPYPWDWMVEVKRVK